MFFKVISLLTQLILIVLCVATLPSEIRLCDITTSADEVMKLLKEINMYKSAGPDNVSPMLLNLASNSLAEPLSKLFNLSLSSGTVPTE